MVSVLVTGGKGYVGSRFINRLISCKESNFRITSIIRRNDSSHQQVQEIIGDLNDTSAFEIELLQAEYVVWFAALRKHYANATALYRDNVEPIEKALAVLKRSKKLRRFIYISSISVLDNIPYSVVPISDQTVPNPETPYGLSKLKAEEIVKTSGCTYLILRLPFMYGSGYKPYSHMWFWERLASSIIIQYKVPKGQVSLLHINDLADIIIKIILQKINPDENTTLLLSDPTIYPIDEILRVLRLNKKTFFKGSLDLSMFIKSIASLLPSKPMRYWSRLLFDTNKFAVIPSDCDVLRHHSFLTLQEGLWETYQMNNVPNGTDLKKV